MIVLGIDAAWTRNQPTGVGLVRRDASGRWECLAVAPSYGTFLTLAAGGPVDWQRPLDTVDVEFGDVLSAAETLAGGRPTIVAVDMPVSREPIRGRRAADRQISRVFGGAGCSTHTPSTERPGEVGLRLSEACRAAGYPIAHASTPGGTQDSLLETYPHPALLSLLERGYRLPYKVSKARKFWPEADAGALKAAVLESFASVLGALRGHMVGIDLELPDPAEVGSLSSLKRFEDALDALVCCWVGMEYLEGRAKAHGDDSAAIWVPGDAEVRVRPAPESLRR